MLQNDPSLVEKLDSTPGASLAEKLKTFLQNQDGKGAVKPPSMAAQMAPAHDEEEEAAAEGGAAEEEETNESHAAEEPAPRQSRSAAENAKESFPRDNDDEDDDDDDDEDFQMDEDEDFEENDESIEELMRKVKAQKDKAQEKNLQQPRGTTATTNGELARQARPFPPPGLSTRHPFTGAMNSKASGAGGAAVQTVKVKPLSHVAPTTVKSASAAATPSMSRPFLGGSASSSTSTTFSQLKQIALSLQNDPAVANQLATGPPAGSLKEQLQQMAKHAQGKNPGRMTGMVLT